MSGIFYGANTEYHIDYVDSLFLCVSAMTVTGLSTNNLSELSGFQQSLLFVQMIMGNIITISLVMIMVRQYFFRQEFRHIIEARRQAEEEAARRQEAENGPPTSPLQKLRRLSQSFSHSGTPPPMMQQTRPEHTGAKLRWTDLFRHSAPPTAENTPRHSLDEPRARSDDSHRSSPSSLEKAHRDNGHAEVLTPKRPPMPDRQLSGSKVGKKKGKGWKGTKLRTDMIQRVEGGGVGLVNPMGWYHSPMEGPPPPLEVSIPPRESYELSETHAERTRPEPILNNLEGIMQMTEEQPREYYTASPTELSRVQSRDHPSAQPPETRRSSEPTNHPPPLTNAEEKFPRTKTIAFDDNVDKDRPQRGSQAAAGGGGAPNRDFVYPSYGRTTGYMPRTGTIRSVNAGQGLPVTRSEFRGLRLLDRANLVCSNDATNRCIHWWWTNHARHKHLRLLQLPPNPNPQPIRKNHKLRRVPYPVGVVTCRVRDVLPETVGEVGADVDDAADVVEFGECGAGESRGQGGWVY